MTAEAILPHSPQPVASDVPIPILPVLDASNTVAVDSFPPPTVSQEVSTHTPATTAEEAQVKTNEVPERLTPIAVAAAEQEAAVALPVEEPSITPSKPESPSAETGPASSTQTEMKSKANVVAPEPATPVRSSPAPATPEKTVAKNGTINSPGSGQTTPIKHRFPTDDLDDSTGSIRSKGSGTRKKRTSIFGKIKHAFSHHHKESSGLSTP